MHIDFIPEFRLQQADKVQIASLLQRVFPETKWGNKPYFKQLPHHRFLAKEGDILIGHVAIDYRVMNMAGVPIQVMGIIALGVDNAYRNRGIATELMRCVENTAKEIPGNVDFIFLVTDIPAYYERLGYIRIPLSTTWLKIHQYKNYGVATERITDSYFMIKQIGDKPWQGEELDLLGYMY